MSAPDPRVEFGVRWQTCAVCGKRGAARVCASDGSDPICHEVRCEEPCPKCQRASEAEQLAASPERPQPRDITRECILDVREACKDRAADERAATAAYAALRIQRHDKDSFAADIWFGHFENARLQGEAALDKDRLDDFRHRTRCWTCTPPRPQHAKEWCVHPLELWTLRKRQPDALRLGDLANQILVLQEKRAAVLGAVPAPVREILSRRLAHLFDVARYVKAKEARR